MWKTANSEFRGVISLASVYIMWGLFPLYYKALGQVPSDQILSHRIFWTFLFASIILTLIRKWNLKQFLRDRTKIFLILLSSILINTNSLIFILAVKNNHIIETSLGYYINPLLSVLLGFIFLKEQLDSFKVVSLLLSTVGVVILISEYGGFPWYAISLALSFGLYGLVKKITNLDSLLGVALESGLIAPFSFLYLVAKQFNGLGSWGNSAATTFLLPLLGVITVIPFWLFAQSVKKVPLATVGFVQYLTPTISLIIGIAIYKEPFSTIHLIGFGFIWLALIIYTYSLITGLKRFRIRPSSNSSINRKI